MSGLRRRFAGLGLIACLVASAGAGSAARASQSSCAGMQHKCCTSLKIASRCCKPSAPADASTLAETRFEVPSVTAVVTAVSAVLLLPPDPHATAAVNVPAPGVSPPDLVTLHSSLLI